MNELQERFNKIYIVNGLWERIRFWFFFKRVYRQKITTLWEANLDKIYYESQFASELSYNDEADRNLLAAENRKPLDQQNQIAIADIENRIDRNKKIQGGYYKNETFIDDVEIYIKMLDLWKTPKQDPDLE